MRQALSILTALFAALIGAVVTGLRRACRGGAMRRSWKGAVVLGLAAVTWFAAPSPSPVSSAIVGFHAPVAHSRWAEELADHLMGYVVSKEAEGAGGQNFGLLVEWSLPGTWYEKVLTAITDSVPVGDDEECNKARRRLAATCAEILPVAHSAYFTRWALLAGQRDRMIAEGYRLEKDQNALSDERDEWTKEKAPIACQYHELYTELTGLRRKEEALARQQQDLADEEQSLSREGEAYEQNPAVQKYRSDYAHYIEWARHWEPNFDLLHHIEATGELPPWPDNGWIPGTYPWVPGTADFNATWDPATRRRLWQLQVSAFHSEHQELLRLRALIDEHEARVNGRKAPISVASQENQAAIARVTARRAEVGTRLDELARRDDALSQREREWKKAKDDLDASVFKWKADMDMLSRLKKNIIDVCERKRNAICLLEAEHEARRKREGRPGSGAQESQQGSQKNDPRPLSPAEAENPVLSALHEMSRLSPGSPYYDPEYAAMQAAERARNNPAAAMARREKAAQEQALMVRKLTGSEADRTEANKYFAQEQEKRLRQESEKVAARIVELEREKSSSRTAVMVWDSDSGTFMNYLDIQIRDLRNPKPTKKLLKGP